MSTKKVNSETNKEASVDLEKREFMEKAGKYAAGVGMATLMTPTLSTANSYENNGWGNGPDSAPGNSRDNNGAENEDGGTHQIHGDADPQP